MTTPWRAQPGPQLEAIRRDTVDEMLFGGAVFGGKSDFLLGDFGQDVPREYGPHWHGILFRKTYGELEDLIARSKQIYPGWFDLSLSRHWSVANKMWTWPNGATLKFRYLESDDDWAQYWGHAYSWIGWDEIGLFASSTPYMMLKARLRSAQSAIPNKRIRATANPGGAGHHWVKRYFGIDRFPLGGHIIEANDGSGMRRMFVRSRVADNKLGLSNDPGYIDRLNGLGSHELVRALKEGDWNVISGAFFPEFETARHVIDPFEIPDHWSRFRAMDWGSAAPFSVGWYAVTDGSVAVPWHGFRDGGKLYLPRGALIKYREWYGAKPDGKGLKLTAEEVADGIRTREGAEKILFSVLDPSAFAANGGPSIAERMADRRVRFWRADNKRTTKQGAIGGWDQLRARLVGTAERDKDTGRILWENGGCPMLYFFSTCPETIRTLPALQHDSRHMEDVDTTGEDHAPDETRYACMSRPYVRDVPEAEKKPRWLHEMTANEAFWGDGQIGSADPDRSQRGWV